MKASFCEENFAVLSHARTTLLNRLRTQYLSAKESGSEDATRCLNTWERQYEVTINGAQTIAALKQLQALPALPNIRLSNKLSDKLRRLQRAEERAKKNASRKAAIQNPGIAEEAALA